MFTAEHYRQQAERCRRLAEQKPASKFVTRWLSLAQDYAGLAEQLEKRRLTPQGEQRSRQPESSEASSDKP